MLRGLRANVCFEVQPVGTERASVDSNARFHRTLAPMGMPRSVPWQSAMCSSCTCERLSDCMQDCACVSPGLQRRQLAQFLGWSCFVAWMAVTFGGICNIIVISEEHPVPHHLQSAALEPDQVMWVLSRSHGDTTTALIRGYHMRWVVVLHLLSRGS